MFSIDLMVHRIVAVTVVCGVFLSACGTNPADTASDAELTGAIFSLHCERGWADCYSEARRRCASGHFEELDRNAIEAVGIDNRSSQTMHAQINSMNSTITIRCK